MTERSVKRFKPASQGDCVTVPIPDVHMFRGDAKNIMACVMEVEDGGFYRLGTRHGILKQLYSRNQFEVLTESKNLDFSTRMMSRATRFPGEKLPVRTLSSVVEASKNVCVLQSVKQIAAVVKSLV